MVFAFSPTLVCPDHLLAEINSNEIILEDIVVKHVFGGLAKVNDPLGNCRWPDPERHVLGVRCTGGMVVAANAADATGDEMCITRILAFMKMLLPRKIDEVL